MLTVGNFALSSRWPLYFAWNSTCPIQCLSLPLYKIARPLRLAFATCLARCPPSSVPPRQHSSLQKALPQHPNGSLRGRHSSHPYLHRSSNVEVHLLADSPHRPLEAQHKARVYRSLQGISNVHADAFTTSCQAHHLVTATRCPIASGCAVLLFLTFRIDLNLQPAFLHSIRSSGPNPLFLRARAEQLRYFPSPTTATNRELRKCTMPLTYMVSRSGSVMRARVCQRVHQVRWIAWTEVEEPPHRSSPSVAKRTYIVLFFSK